MCAARLSLSVSLDGARARAHSDTRPHTSVALSLSLSSVSPFLLLPPLRLRLSFTPSRIAIFLSPSLTYGSTRSRERDVSVAASRIRTAFWRTPLPEYTTLVEHDIRDGVMVARRARRRMPQRDAKPSETGTGTGRDRSTSLAGYNASLDVVSPRLVPTSSTPRSFGDARAPSATLAALGDVRRRSARLGRRRSAGPPEGTMTSSPPY